MKIIKRIISIKISCLLVAQQSLIAGGLTVDKTAPTSNQANLESARNGVPIVNIVAPNQKGLSHNKFSDYNVNKEGLILNNSNKREVNTQLSGYIYGNQNLKNGTAKTILNEVTSKKKSELKGFTEVAGDRANVVVANPNGIYINGAGFINTSRATITTGNPNIKNGEIDSFDVRQGQIDVDGTGLNLSNVNKAELYAQTVKLNAKIHSQDLDVVTGQNSISKDGTITNIENSIDEKPTLSIDSSALGGIYANKISLVGTQKGVGVNLPIEISAQDDFKLSADGKIVLDKVISEKSIDIKSDSSDINSNLLYSKDIKLNAADKIVNENTIASRDSLTIQSSIIENKNLITSGVNEKLEDVSNGDINIISHSLVNDNIIYATNDLNINSNTLENKNASMQANNINITLNSDLILDKNSSIKALNNLTLSSKSLTNNSLIIANNTLSINSSDYIVNNSSLSSNNLNLIATNDIINNDNASLNSGVLSLSSKSLNNYGIIYSLYNTNIDVIDIINYASIVSSNNENIASSLNITAQNFTNYNTLFSNDNINLYIKNSLLNKTDKSIVDLGSEKATIFAKNNLSIQGNKDKTVRTEEITNDKSVIQTEQGNIDIFANKLDNLNDKAIIGKKNNGSGKFEISSTTDKLPVSISDISETDPNKVLERLRQIYKPILSIVTPMYDENYYNLFGGKYYLLITDRNFYGKSAYKYEYYYSSQIDYFINKPNEINGGRILGGNNINFDVLNLSNYVSQVYAKNDISFTNTSLINNSETLYKSDTVSGEYNRDKKSDVQFTPKITKTKIETLDSTISAGGKITGDINTLQNGVNQGENIEYTTFSPYTNNITKDNISTNKKNLDDFFDNVSLPTNKYGMFVPTNPNKNLDYLIESNPIYTDYSKYIGSSYFLDKIDFKGEKITKRLGDAAYETKLVNDQILNQTGKKFLSQDYTSENIQFVSLMDNAVNLSGILGLELGKPLSKQQLENLTKDIVWMEEKVINGQKVLVPVVYLANDYKKIDGASINASFIDLNVQNSMTNSGTIKSDNDIKLTSDSITNNSGVILANGNATLISKDDFVNKNGGVIKANDIQIASTEGSVINETFSQKNIINQGRDNFTYTLIGNTSSIQANNNLIIQAKNDIINTGANLSATNSVLLQTQNGDINLNAITLENGRNQYSNGGFEKVQDINYQVSNINANNIIMQSGKDINLEASKLNATNQINLNAKNDINIEALNNLHYTDSKSTSKGFLSKTTKRDMVYKESVNSAELNANDIYMTSRNDINLEAVNINARNEKIAHAENSLNILAKTYKEGELHHTSKSSWGGMIKSEYKYEKDNLKIKSSQITADNMILDAKTINVEASKLKANSVEISTEILNMISSKESLYENEFSNKGGILTATIENKGKIEEIVIPSTIEVNDKLIFNKKDITDKLETDNLIKTLSSQGNLTEEQINLVKQIANSKEWHDKTTTLSGMGALIITAIVTYFTAGAGAGLAGSLSGAAAAGASATATQVAVQAAIQATIQAVATQATTSLVSAAITGNKPKLDLDSLAKSAVTAGVLSYAKGLIDVAEYGKVAQTLTDTSIQSGVQSVVFKTDFKDTLVSNLAMAGTNLAFENVGNISMSQELGEQNSLFKDGALGKVLLHSLVGGTVSAIQDKDILSGVLSAGFREALSPLTANSSNEAKLLTSQLTGILVGGLVGGEEGANNGYIISTSGELYNRQLHQDEINWLKDDKNIEEFANSKNITIEEARKELTQTALSLIDDNWKKVLKETNSDAENYLLNNVASIKNTTDLERANSFQNETVAINNIDFYKKYVHPDIQKDIATVLKDDIENKATEYKEVFEKIKEQGVEKTLNVAKEKLGNYYDENTYLEMLKDGGKVLQSIIEDSVNSTVKLGYNLTTSPKNLAEIYNISVEEATAIQAILVVAAANEFGIKKTKAADNVLDLGVDDSQINILKITNNNLGRDKPGVISSNINTLPTIKEGDIWLKGTNSNAAKIPSQIAEKLNGKSFNSFDEFRSAFWKEVANDSALSKQFDRNNITLMKDGKAPYSIVNEQVGGRVKYELDHNIEIQNGGNVYDLNNIIVRTPYNHIKKTSDTKKAN
ncbi:filamentous hemagglutinin N-terminal domain-containing protein [Aliarcobacter butzleri]|uniref:two-partner secretion domain-containing protein n=1 Tax=Aliarcobacter butzleri TaxID=28197 RepID=UPI001EDD8165|nr:filamentous hemagglutinin N-terminal domain-containing protein [Aliarcobacter butzleri]MCG3680101.1 filamentous hemagglutinin N-terminal domain-containing protein [Aliarcobacter butzleri]